MWRMKATVALALMLTPAFAGAATAGPVLERIQKKGELVVGMSGDQPPLNVTARDGRIIGLEKMTERWFKDGSWLKELP